VKAMLEMVRRHRAGEPVGITSVCSAHPLVIRAALGHAQASGADALIEATSNQVNQNGGYTGLTPAQFRDVVFGLADAAGLPRARVLLGGDHLGPNPWQDEPAQPALERSQVLIRQYVGAGFRKIHLDCSMSCADDPRRLPDELIASRTALLAAAAEDSWHTHGGEPPVYVIGTEVPVPGGAHESLQELLVTAPAAAQATLAAHRAAFLEHGLEAAWERVVGLVVQPGVEFDHDRVIDYVPGKARRLSAWLEEVPRLLVFEAHSTDYQRGTSLAALVRDHFAILKVGPALTFALREAVWALDQLECEWLGRERAAGVRATLLATMHADPRHWRKYYHATGHALELELQYSLSDRIRYYWPAPAVVASLERLAASFASRRPPLALLHQYLPGAYEPVRSGALSPRLDELVIHHVREVLAQYSAACNPPTQERSMP